MTGRAPSGQALAVPATPASAVDGPSGFDPSRIAKLVKAVNHYDRPFLENAKVRTPIEVTAGPWSGHVIRRAKKLYKCDDQCGHYLHPGQLYMEGEVNPYRAGGFAHDRMCLKCAGVMALHAVAIATEARRAETTGSACEGAGLEEALPETPNPSRSHPSGGGK